MIRYSRGEHTSCSRLRQIKVCVREQTLVSASPIGLYERVFSTRIPPVIFPIRSTQSLALLSPTPSWTLQLAFCGTSLHPYLRRMLCSICDRRFLRDSPVLMNFFLWGFLFFSIWVMSLILVPRLRPLLKFVWHCFLRPIGESDQRTRLDKVRRTSIPSNITPSCSQADRSSTRGRLRFMIRLATVSFAAGTPC